MKLRLPVPQRLSLTSGNRITPDEVILPACLVAVAYACKLLIVLRNNLWNVPYWASWADQGLYLKSSRAFAALKLDAAEHYYPLLYPMIEAPFAALIPRFPFIFSNLGLFVCSYVGFARVASTFGVGRAVGAALFCLTTVAYPEFGNTWIEPWSTTLASALIWLALADALDWLLQRTAAPSGIKAARLGLLLAAIPLSRPADAVITAVMLVFIVAVSLARGGLRRQLLISTGAGTALIAAYAALFLLIYGPHTTPYMDVSAKFGIMPTWLGWKAYLILVEPLPWYPYGQGLLQVCPWLILGASGLVGSCFVGSDKRLGAVMVLAVVATYLWVMLTYVDLLPSGLWKWGNINYFKWLMPLFGLFSLVFVRIALGHAKLAAACFTMLFTAALVHATPVRARPDEPARALLIRARSKDFEATYRAGSIVTDRVGTFYNQFEYKQVPFGSDLLAIAQKRDFMGGERWFPQASASVRSPGELRRPEFDGPARSPVDRYKVHWTLGLPCWLPPYPCGLAKRTH